MPTLDEFIRGFPRRRIPIEPEWVSVRVEEIWERAIEWAKANGKKHEPSYGIVGVAPT